MKNLLLVLVVLVSSSAFAATDDFGSSSSENLLNLTYYPHSGRLFFETEFESTLHDTIGQTEQEYFSNFSFFAEYGLPVNGLRVEVSATDNVSATTLGATGSNSGVGNTSLHTGISDPTISLLYRLVDMNPQGISVDLELSGTPSLGTSYGSQNGLAGSNSTGYGTLSFAAAAYWSTSINDLRISGSIAREFAGDGNLQDSTDPSSSTTFTRSSLWLPEAELIDRVRLTNRFFVQGEAEFLFGHSSLYTYSNFYSPTTDDSEFHVEPILSVGYLFTKETLITLFASYQDFEQIDTNQNGSANDIPIRDLNWGLAYRMEF
jgi:hypothetical protein